MRCQEVSCWTFSGLVAAFLDLSVAFSLLCASSLVYLTSKLLGVFGLNLPCPCDGLFSENKCFQETLVNLPVRKISSVQRSVKSTTPFDSFLYKEANGGGGEWVGKKRKGEHRHVEFERDIFSTPEVENASCFHLLTSQSLKKGSFKAKSKRLSKNSPQSPASVMEYLNDAEDNDQPLLVNSKDCGKDLRKSVSLCSIGCESADDRNKQPERRTLSWAGEGTCTSPVDLTQKKTSETLERASRAALALELEKERNAAATAADEALGMILRLQEEKASIEMEARQYQRMIEEKSAFDAEEMSILKEILLRREREKHFLEKEVDTYRQMFLQQPLLNTPTEESQTPQQTTDSFGFEIFPNQMDNEVNGVDQRDESTSEGVLVDVKPPQEIEEGTSFPEPDSDSHDIDCCVHDIHVVKDEEDNKVQLNVPSDHIVRDLKLDRSQSVLGTSYGFPQGRRIMSPNMRRNSMSAVDYERLKIESEVGLLRGRLRAVQKGREKFSFSSKEQSKSQVQRFGDKTSRFWEARISKSIDSTSPTSTMVKAMSMSFDLHSA